MSTNETELSVESNPAWDAADAKNPHLLYYAYILELVNGGYYAGHTNNLKARLAEHALGTTAATRGKKGRLVWFTQTYEREHATKIEARLKRAIGRRDPKLQEAIADFDSLVAIVKPQKTLAELVHDDQTHRAQMERWMHVVLWHPNQTACGWAGKAYGYRGDDAWDNLTRDARVHAAAEAAGGRADGRKPCERCLELMPAEYRTA